MKYIVYKDPSNDYENVIERFCLRERVSNPHCKKSDIIAKGIRMWKEKKMSGNKKMIKEFLRLTAGEKPFVR